MCKILSHKIPRRKHRGNLAFTFWCFAIIFFDLNTEYGDKSTETNKWDSLSNISISKENNQQMKRD